MIENNKKTVMSRERWARVFSFLASEEDSIRTKLAASVHPDMIRADVFLLNATKGNPGIGIEVMEPDGGEKLLACTIKRPVLYYPMLIKREIQDISLYELINTLVNQIDVM